MSDLVTPVPLLNHGVVGNGRVLALVAPDTHIDWLCFPRFDSASVFARLLDVERGGSFAFEVGDSAQFEMAYVTNTNVLKTRVTTADGAFDVFDYAPRVPEGLGVHAPVEIHRIVVPVEGQARIRVHFDPRPDYARATPDILEVANGLDVRGGPISLHLRSNVPAPYLKNGALIRLDQPRYFILSCGAPPETLYSLVGVQETLQYTIDGWRAWAKTCALPSFSGPEVLRSALCLKLHAFIETGAIIAATTTSIPEALGTERTWDYRYCWLRDAAFVVEALRRLSHLAEGEAFVAFLRDVAEQGPLQPLYGIGGERDLHEVHLDHLAGFAGSGPVRIGNAAALQTQHDLMGEMVLCLETMMTDPRLVHDDPGLFELARQLVEKAIAVADVDDTGLWEFRERPRPYTFSKVLCWVAAHRGARLARLNGHPELADRWEDWATARRSAILETAYSPTLGFFTQALHGEHPDASLLLLPTLGFIDARDPRFVSTLQAYERLLVRDGLMLRYQHPDDFGETTSAFLVCSFWWVEALAMMGDLDRAVEIFTRLVTHANPVGLFSEDIDPKTGRLLGNFPQAYTHVGLIHAAITIGELLEARDSRFRAWT